MQRNIFSLTLIFIFITILFIAAGLNIWFIGKSREELTKTVLRNPSSIRNQKQHIISILPALSDPFLSNIEAGIQQEAENLDSAVQFFYYSSDIISGHLLPVEAYRYVDIALRSGADGIIMYFPAGAEVETFLRKAQAFNIPFVPVAMDVPAKPIEGFVTSDSYAQGRESASIAISLLGKDARIGVILPSGTPNSFTIAEEPFLQGAHKAIEEKGKGEIIAVEREEVSILGSEEACSLMIQNYPEINAFICTNARNTVSVAQVIIDRGLVGKIIIVGADENAEVTRLLEKGVVQATVVRDAVQMGRASIKTLQQIRKGFPQNPLDC
ncbi:MAG: substrate-binding domain-containing protein [Spirochaetales bacterium]